MVRHVHTLLFLAVLLLAPRMVFAQTAIGTPPFSSAQRSSFDTIDLANLNVHFAIPIIHKPGRGVLFRYSMSYDSSIWVPTTVGLSKAWYPVNLLNPTWGWTAQSAAMTGSVPILNSSLSCFVTNPITGQRTKVSYPITIYTGYEDPNGVFHAAGIQTTPGYANCDSGPVPPVYGGTQAASDGSGYVLTVNLQANPSIVVQSPGGMDDS